MPTYSRKCLKCDELFDVHCRIADKETPKKCPYCDSEEGTYMLSVPMFMSRSDRLMGKKDTGFTEVLSKIAERNKRTPLQREIGK